MRIPRSPRFTAAAVLALVAAGIAAGARARTLRAGTAADPPWWDVAMTVEGRGEYEARPDNADARYAGSFTFAFAWSGALQKDDEDYLLVHKTSQLTAWWIEERATFNEAVTTLTTADIGDKPELKVGYILKRDGGLQIAFEVIGFDVPKLAGSDTFPLILPVSAEGSRGRRYDVFLQSGSNKVVLEEGALARGPEEKTFAWTWKSQGWVQKRGASVFQSSSHEARIRIVVTPGK